MKPLPPHNYSYNTCYFFTISVKDRKHFFGSVKSKAICLSVYGSIAHSQWYRMEQQHPYIWLHSFVIMPDHIQGILEMKPNRTKRNKTLTGLIGLYKASVAKKIHLAGGKEFAWQSSFYYHTIRNYQIYCTATEYIQNKPLRWTPPPYSIRPNPFNRAC